MGAVGPASYWLVMPAAGSGQRFGAPLPKQYAQLSGRTVIEHALAPFVSDLNCLGIVVAIAAGDPHWPAVAARLAAAGAQVRSAPGGDERARSVRNALAELSRHAAADDWVAVHDAARPCLSGELRDRVLEGARSHAVGALLAVPVADTLKRAHGAEVASTVDRSGLWAAQTPQVFRYGELCSALDEAFALGRLPTDESQAIEWGGRWPRLVEGSVQNLKVTSPVHLKLAEAYLA